MRVYTIFFLVLFSVQFSFGQLDSEKSKTGPIKLKNFKVPKVDAPKKQDTTPKFTIDFEDPLEKREEEYLKKFSYKKEDKAEPIMMEKPKQKYDYNEELKNKLNKKITESNQGNTKDQFFGKFVVETKRIKLYCRDYQEVDGDIVSIILNENTEERNLELTGGAKVIYIDLLEGDNFLDIVAMNQGSSGPNTAQFSIFDDNNNLVISNEWNLNTGVKANFIIYYKKKIEAEVTTETKKENNTTQKQE